MLAGALAAYVMVKFYGVVFLGRAREGALVHAHDANGFGRAALIWLAAACVVLLLLLNWRLYAFFAAQRGLPFALCAIPLHWFYYLYSTLAFALGVLMWLLSAPRRA